MSRAHRTLRIASALAVVAAASTARADNASLAEELFKEGRAAMRRGDCAEALPKLAESDRLDPSIGTKLNLALCEEQEQRLATAWAHFRAVVDELPAGDPRVSIARERANALEPRVPHLRLLVPPNAPELVVALDGVPLGAASVGVALPVDPGPHTVEARTSMGVARVALNVAESETTDAVVPLPTSTREPARSSVQRTIGWGIAGAGAAGVVASVVLGGLVLEEKAAVANDCQAKVCNPAGLTAGRAGSAFATAATVCFSVGVAAVIGGVSLVVTAGNAPGASPAGAAPSVRIGGSF